MAKQAKKHHFNPDTYPYNDCRRSHQWRIYDLVEDVKTKRGYIVEKCKNCTTKRFGVISSITGLPIKPWSYNWPEDYPVPGGLNRSELGQIRLRWFRRELERRG